MNKDPTFLVSVGIAFTPSNCLKYKLRTHRILKYLNHVTSKLFESSHYFWLPQRLLLTYFELCMHFGWSKRGYAKQRVSYSELMMFCNANYFHIDRWYYQDWDDVADYIVSYCKPTVMLKFWPASTNYPSKACRWKRKHNRQANNYHN